MIKNEIKPHVQRAHHLRTNSLPLLTAEQEAELEKDLVPEEQWRAVRVLPIHLQEVNAEQINDRVKLLFHRLIARRLGQDPSILELARVQLAKIRESREDRTYMHEWAELLALPAEILRREIVRRDERMTRLRNSSPLGHLIDVRDPDLRRRVWRNARRALSVRRGQA